VTVAKEVVRSLVGPVRLGGEPGSSGGQSRGGEGRDDGPSRDDAEQVASHPGGSRGRGIRAPPQVTSEHDREEDLKHHRDREGEERKRVGRGRGREHSGPDSKRSECDPERDPWHRNRISREGDDPPGGLGEAEDR